MGISDDFKIVDMLNLIISRLKKEDFVFTKEYKIKNIFVKSSGKWPSVLQNSVFIDSTNFYKIYLVMLFDRIIKKAENDLYKFDY